MMSQSWYHNPVSYSYGLRDSKERADEFAEEIEVHIDGSEYSTTDKADQATRVLFRTHLKDKALDWYRDLPDGPRSQGTELKKVFLEEFRIIPQRL